MLVCGMALYQSYFSVAVGLAMILVLKKILENTPCRRVLFFGLKALGMLFLGLALYAIVIKLSGVQLSDEYNGLSGVGDFSGVSAFSLLKGTYRYILRYFLHPITHNAPAMLAANIVLFAIALFCMVRRLIANKTGPSGIILAAVICCLLPLGLNILYVITKGTIHQLMVFSFNLVYVAAILLMELEGEAPESAGHRKKYMPALRIVSTVAAALILFNNIVYANDVYIRKDLEYQATQATMTRVLDRMEQTEGYVPGKTPVIWLGDLEVSALSADRGESFAALQDVGLWSNFSVTYETTLRWYLKYVMGYPIRYAAEKVKKEYTGRDEVRRMPAFPAVGCCKMIDGNMVVKLSEAP